MSSHGPRERALRGRRETALPPPRGRSIGNEASLFLLSRRAPNTLKHRYRRLSLCWRPSKHRRKLPATLRRLERTLVVCLRDPVSSHCKMPPTAMRRPRLQGAIVGPYTIRVTLIEPVIHVLRYQRTYPQGGFALSYGGSDIYNPGFMYLYS